MWVTTRPPHHPEFADSILVKPPQGYIGATKYIHNRGMLFLVTSEDLLKQVAVHHLETVQEGTLEQLGVIVFVSWVYLIDVH